ncbi:MAG: type II secretion system protein [Bdellovibrionales bacterium]|nr:type II secretion system protein [Bdellovibrionales bacterium]
MKWNKGFTLIEVMLAVAIIAGVAVTLTIAWNNNFSRHRKAKMNNIAAILLQQKITEYELKFKGEKLERIPEEESGDFGEEYPQYRWQFKSQDFEMPDLKPLLVTEDGSADETVLTIVGQMQEYFNKSIKEAEVTVIFKNKSGRERNFSVPFYFVDYDQDVSALKNLGGSQ